MVGRVLSRRGFFFFFFHFLYQSGRHFISKSIDMVLFCLIIHFLESFGKTTLFETNLEK